MNKRKNLSADALSKQLDLFSTEAALELGQLNSQNQPQEISPHLAFQPIAPRSLEQQHAMIAPMITALFPQNVAAGDRQLIRALLQLLLDHATTGSTAVPLNIAARVCNVSIADIREKLHTISEQLHKESQANPFVLNGDFLALSRFAAAEMFIAQWLIARSDDSLLNSEDCESIDSLAGNQSAISAQFSKQDSSLSNEQWHAVRTAATKRFAFILGGPGTGKTNTIAELVKVLVAQLETCHVTLRAPIYLLATTGKAAARLAEVLDQPLKVNLLNEFNEVNGANQTDMWQSKVQVHTLHRLLRQSMQDGDTTIDWWRPRGERKKIHASAVIVDEASMLDAELMADLLCALGDKTRLILVGDPDQLPAIEPGQVIDSWVKARTNLGDLRMAHTALLTKNFRSGNASTIHGLASSINAGDALATLDYLKQVDEDGNEAHTIDSAITWRPSLVRGVVNSKSTINSNSGDTYAALMDFLLSHFENYIAMLSQPLCTPVDAHRVLNQFRVLTPIRQSSYGVAAINRILSERICQSIATRRLASGYIKSTASNDVEAQLWPLGRVIMVTINSPQLNLANGDVGVMMADGFVHFEPRFNFRLGEIVDIKMHHYELPQFEDAFALTVHKAQGSEFDHVAIVLPTSVLDEGAATVVSRQLLYTAVTRAKHRVTLIADARVIARAVETIQIRHSLLPHLLTNM